MLHLEVMATPQAPTIEVMSQLRYVMLEYYSTSKPILQIVFIRARSYFIKASVSFIDRLYC